MQSTTDQGDARLRYAIRKPCGLQGNGATGSTRIRSRLLPVYDEDICMREKATANQKQYKGIQDPVIGTNQSKSQRNP